MAQMILLVTRHNFFRPQLIGLKKIHGNSVIICKENVRFRTEGDECTASDHPNILDFHKQKLADGYDFIYYIIPEKLQKILLEHHFTFGVIERPECEKGSNIISITHRSLNKKEEKYRKKLERKGSLGYRNRAPRKRAA